MKFTKMQAAGNDYVVIESTGREGDWSRMAMTLCERHYGIGADSLLVLLSSDKADLMMRIIDPDGSEAEACGNGIRCLARYAFEKGIIDRQVKQITVETISGVRTVQLKTENGRLVNIQANMGVPRFEPEAIPVKLNHNAGQELSLHPVISYPLKVDGLTMVLNLVSMGNPHTVYFQQQPVADFPLSTIGPKVEKLNIFTNRTNFEVVRAIDNQQVEARVWERGVGETLACGSGACAIIAAGQMLGYLGKKVEVKVPGGVLHVEWNGEEGVLLSGPAEIVYTGEWPEGA